MSPFSRELLDLNEAELDFILEMYALDNPKEFQFNRGGEKPNQAEVMAAWDRVLEGHAKEARFGKLPRAMLKRWTERFNGAMATLTGRK